LTQAMLFNERLMQFLTAENVAYRLQPHHEEFRAGQARPAEPQATARKEDVMLCRDVMKKKVFVCHEDDTVAQCARTMRDQNIGFIPIVDDEGLVSGVVTDRDLAVRVLAEGLSVDTPVRTIMTRDVRICWEKDPLRTAERKMAEVKRSRLVIVDDERRCVGVISLSDVALSDSRSQAGHVLYEVTQRKTARPALPA
jgi:CBS domain-containing protein